MVVERARQCWNIYIWNNRWCVWWFCNSSSKHFANVNKNKKRHENQKHAVTCQWNYATITNQTNWTSYLNLSDKVRELRGRPFLSFAASFSSSLVSPLNGSTELKPSLRNAACWAGRCWWGNQEQWLPRTVFQPWPYSAASVPSTTRANLKCMQEDAVQTSVNHQVFIFFLSFCILSTGELRVLSHTHSYFMCFRRTYSQFEQVGS